MTQRDNPFGNVEDFAPASSTKPVQREAIDEIARQNGFPSRSPALSTPEAASPPKSQPQVRQAFRYTTGRNRQLNLRATDETIERFYRLSEELKMPLGAVFELAVEALINQRSGK